MSTAVDGAAHGGCRALDDGAKGGIGGAAPRGDEAGRQKGSLRMDRVQVGMDGDCARGQSHLRTFQRGEGVLEARRPRPCRLTPRRSGSDGGDRRRRGRQRGVRVGSSGAGVAVRKAHGSQRIWVKPARDMLHVEAEILDLVEPAREEAVDVMMSSFVRSHETV